MPLSLASRLCCRRRRRRVRRKSFGGYSLLFTLCRANCAAPVPFQPVGSHTCGAVRPGPLRRKLNLTCDSVNSNNGNGNSRFSSFDDPGDMETTQMGGSDPAVIGELQESNENPFPKRNFDEDSKDPLEQLKNQVSSKTSGPRIACVHICWCQRRQGL